MKRRFTLSRALAITFVLLACDETPTAPSPKSVRLGESFDLKVGETARLEGDSLILTFNAVRSDSRCPVDVTCIQAGEAVVVFDARAEGSERRELVFDVPPGGGDEERFARYRIRIVELRPPAESTKTIDPASYVARVLLERS